MIAKVEGHPGYTEGRLAKMHRSTQGHYVQDRVVVITGGSSGFGLEAARILLGMGANVAITGRREDHLAAAARELGPEDLLAVRADANRTADWKALAEEVLAKWGGKATNFVPGAARTGCCDAAGIDSGWLECYPSARDFASTLVHCIDVPPELVIEEVGIWGTKQVAEMLNPF